MSGTGRDRTGPDVAPPGLGGRGQGTAQLGGQARAGPRVGSPGRGPLGLSPSPGAPRALHPALHARLPGPGDQVPCALPSSLKSAWPWKRTPTGPCHPRGELRPWLCILPAPSMRPLGRPDLHPESHASPCAPWTGPLPPRAPLSRSRVGHRGRGGPHRVDTVSKPFSGNCSVRRERSLTSQPNGLAP